jgi:hypothetical protein
MINVERAAARSAQLIAFATIDAAMPERLKTGKAAVEAAFRVHNKRCTTLPAR